MYNCSKWPVPLQLNVTLLLPGILWLRNMLLVLPNVHNPDCFFSHRWPCALFRPGQVPTPLLVVSSSLSPPHPSAAPPVHIRLSAGTWKNRVFIFKCMATGALERWYINIPMGEFSGRGLVGVWHCSDEYTKLHKKKLEHGRRFCTMYWTPTFGSETALLPHTEGHPR
jgi:hypothetical protein